VGCALLLAAVVVACALAVAAALLWVFGVMWQVVPW
jgi:hypothetical protein